MKEARMANGSNTGVNDRIEGYGQVLCHLINSLKANVSKLIRACPRPDKGPGRGQAITPIFYSTMFRKRISVLSFTQV